MIEIPALERLEGASSVLLFGAGGGYDILGGVPLLAALRARGKRVALAGVTFSSLRGRPGTEPDGAHACLLRVGGEAAAEDAYCPEAWLARWLSERGLGDSLWVASKVGVRPLRAAMAHIVRSVSADAVVLVDGGVDIILRGDETSLGTPAEDLASLCALSGLDVPVRLVMCLGFGSELREGIPHAQVLERVAELARLGGYLGAVSLHPQSDEGAAYLEAFRFVREGQARLRGSHVQGTVSAAMAGSFGGSTPDQWVSPLSALCWFFSAPEVARSHLFLSRLEETDSIWDVTVTIRGCRKSLPVRARTDIPL
jgi:hypothetical protein